MTDFVHHRGGSGSPLMLLHGFTATWHVWEPLLPALEREHEVFVVALPGHCQGFEFTPGLEFSMDAAITELERTLAATGADRVHIVGNSLGGWLAFQLAARNRARSVVALAPGGGWVHGDKLSKRMIRFFANNYRLLRIGGPLAEAITSRPRLRRLALRDIAAHPERIPASAAAQMVRGAYECPIYLDALALTRRQGLGDFPEPFPTDVPVRIAWGTDDRVLRWPAFAERFRTLLPDADWVELDGLGHVPMYDDPKLVARTILDFTTRVDAQQAPPAAVS